MTPDKDRTEERKAAMTDLPAPYIAARIAGEDRDLFTAEQMRAYAADNRAPHDNKTAVSVHPGLDATHICKDCGAPWRQCDDFSFNLRAVEACPACDNAPVGGQLIPITAPLSREITRLRAATAKHDDELRAASILMHAAEMRAASAPSQPMAGEPLPPLPEPDVGLGVHRWAYSDMQMRDYATAATEALRQRVAELEQLLKVMERQYADALERFQKMQQTDEAEFDVHIDGEYYASTCGPREDAWREAMHYVSQESPGSEMEVFEVFRLPIRFPIGEDK
jgi:hypothetical protein